MLETFLSSARLELRLVTADDLDLLLRVNQDPQVMKYFSKIPTPSEIKNAKKIMLAHEAAHGYGSWIIIEKASQNPVGYISLLHVTFAATFAPALEIGWRLLPSYWGQGYAVEAARAVLEWAFKELHLAEVVAFAVASNFRSRRVMEKLGMQYDPSHDFDHPKFPAHHPFCRHVLYRLSSHLK